MQEVGNLLILHTVALREEEDAATFGRKAVDGTPKASVAFGEGDLFVRFEVGLVGELLGRLVDGGARGKGERTVADGLEEVGFEVEDGLSGAYFLPDIGESLLHNILGVFGCTLELEREEAEGLVEGFEVILEVGGRNHGEMKNYELRIMGGRAPSYNS